MTSEAILTIWLIGALVGTLVGQSKGRAGPGFALGALLGVIGVVIAARLSKTPEKQAEDLGLARDPLGVLMIPVQTSRSVETSTNAGHRMCDAGAGDPDAPPATVSMSNAPVRRDPALDVVRRGLR